MRALELLQSRSSTPSKLMIGPGPDRAQLRELLELAMRVPDHGKLSPWRFVLIQAHAREELGALLKLRKQALEPAASADVLSKEAQRFSYAPTIVAVLACTVSGHKIPVSEQIASANAVCMQLLNAAHVSGFAAQWLTGWAAYDDVIRERLGVQLNEHICGFVHVGHASEKPLERSRADLDSKLSTWVASAHVNERT